MLIISRPFKAMTDPARVTEFIIHANQQQPERGYVHVGDVLWQLYQNNIFDPTRHFRLWENEDDQLLGFAWFERPDGVFFQIRPDLRGTNLLELSILAWAEPLVDTTSPRYDGHLWTRLCDTDPATIAALMDLGFVRNDWFMVKMRHPLPKPVEPPPLPPGYTVRAVGDASEWAQRVDLHRAVWNPSKVTLDAYQRLRQQPGYDQELDLVVVAPDGQLVAYCICWFDPVNQTGEFEPVGTSEAYRGRGLGKVVIYEGLRRLQAKGAHTAYVSTYGDNTAAQRLYESAGFSTYTHEHLYGRPLVVPSAP